MGEPLNRIKGKLEAAYNFATETAINISSLLSSIHSL